MKLRKSSASVRTGTLLNSRVTNPGCCRYLLLSFRGAFRRSGLPETRGHRRPACSAAQGNLIGEPGPISATQHFHYHIRSGRTLSTGNAVQRETVRRRSKPATGARIKNSANNVLGGTNAMPRCGIEIDRQQILCRCLHRRVDGRCTRENATT